MSSDSSEDLILRFCMCGIAGPNKWKLSGQTCGLEEEGGLRQYVTWGDTRVCLKVDDHSEVDALKDRAQFADLYLQSGHVFVVFFCFTKEESLKAAKVLRDSIIRLRMKWGKRLPVPMMLVGTRAMAKEKKIERKVSMQLANEWNCGYAELDVDMKDFEKRRQAVNEKVVELFFRVYPNWGEKDKCVLM